ncbi:hypothetical protein R1flu_023774 [Riccia fluitans]|uniref:Probable quinone oxidoreductase n=1 Tax=Riccia fluitans TaxID=41844 RepID=A0ABD1XSZ5_9MARC
MVKALKLTKYGGPEALQWEDVEVGEPGEGQVRIRQNAVGLNFFDIYVREGLYPFPTPLIPGQEAAGVVTAVGPGVTDLKVGDRVAYAGGFGAYAEERLAAAATLVPIPSNIDDVTAAGALLKGCTAHMLLNCLHVKVGPGVKILVLAAAGGVGSLLCQWGSALGATVFGVVSTEAKAAQAKEDGAHHVLLQSEGDFAEKIKELTNGAGVDIVYDSVGKDTFMQALEALGPRGLIVCFGVASGSPDPVPLGLLTRKSLWLHRPILLHYTNTREDLLACAGEVFNALSSGIIKLRVNQKYPLAQAGQAQEDLKARKTTGSTVLLVDSA